MPALGLAALVVQNGLVNVLQQGRPELALEISHSARAEASLAAIVAARGEAGRVTASALAKSAVRQDSVQPLAYLALALAHPHSDADANRLIDFSSQLSRRYLAVQLWKIERSVNAGDAAGALLNYDIALRTVPTATNILFPVLVAATANAALIEPLAKRLALHPQWAEPFLEQAIKQSPAPVNVALLMKRAADLGAPASEGLETILITRLVAVQQYGLATSVFRRRFGSNDFSLIRNGGFGEKSHQTTLEWILVDEESNWARIGSDEHGRARLDFGGISGRGGVVASQLLVLPPHRYRVSLTTGDRDGGASAHPTLQISCTNTAGAVLLNAQVQVRTGVNRQTWAIEVPSSGCPAQTLQIGVEPDSASETSGWIDDVTIVPADR